MKMDEMSFRQYSRQAGSTLIGFIAGLVLGLAIAVIVAISINKTPVPFMEKSGKGGKQTELNVSPNDDPNKPMYGNKDAAREAAKELAPETPPTPAPASTPAAAQGKPPTAPTQAKTPDAKDAKSGADSAASADKWLYYLQVGAFRNQADAENTKAKLALQGMEASVMERPSDGGSLYRVRIGPFEQVDTMNNVRSKLTESGMDVAVIRVAK